MIQANGMKFSKNDRSTVKMKKPKNTSKYLIILHNIKHVANQFIRPSLYQEVTPQYCEMTRPKRNNATNIDKSTDQDNEEIQEEEFIVDPFRVTNGQTIVPQDKQCCELNPKNDDVDKAKLPKGNQR